MESISYEDFPHSDHEWIKQGLPQHRWQPAMHAGSLAYIQPMVTWRTMTRPLTVTVGEILRYSRFLIMLFNSLINFFLISYNGMIILSHLDLKMRAHFQPLEIRACPTLVIRVVHFKKNNNTECIFSNYNGRPNFKNYNMRRIFTRITTQVTFCGCEYGQYVGPTLHQ